MAFTTTVAAQLPNGGWAYHCNLIGRVTSSLAIARTRAALSLPLSVLSAAGASSLGLRSRICQSSERQLGSATTDTGSLPGPIFHRLCCFRFVSETA